jgi:integration host factor subunit beta
MTKSDMIRRLAQANPHLLMRDIERIVATIFDEIGAALARGDRVELRGFGVFSARQRNARLGRNPKTGEQIEVRSRSAPRFTGGKDLLRSLNFDA